MKLDFYFTKGADITSMTMKNTTLLKATSIMHSDRTRTCRLHVKNEILHQVIQELDMNSRYYFHVNVYFEGFTTIM